jgi:NAD(P)-dependent dehydrogenase (short-subunit alcohol dehydrogenase family)
MAKMKTQKDTRPPQEQKRQPGREHKMEPEPESQARQYVPAGKLKGRKALVTGGDSGIGRAVSVMFAKEGADVAVVYLEEEKDAEETKQLVEETGQRCVLIRGDVGSRTFCDQAVRQTLDDLGGIDILVNNAAEQYKVDAFEQITDEQLERTYRTNVFSQFYITRAALPHMPEGSAIVCTTSVTAYQGHKSLIDYASTKGAIVALVRSLGLALAERGIRVNGVAPGPIWTPLIPASFPAEAVRRFGADTALGRPGQPDEVAPCYVFLASDDASYMTGQILHPNGGRIVNG